MKLEFEGWKCIGHSCDEGGCGRIHDEPIPGVTSPVYVRDNSEPLVWPKLLTLPVVEMPEEVKA